MSKPERVSATVFAETFHKSPALFSYRVRCGNANCRCANGEPHGPYWFLRWRSGSVNRTRYVPKSEVLDVARIVLARKQAERRARIERQATAAQLRGVFSMCRELTRDGQW